MTKTREQLVARALQELRVVGAGQTAPAEDSSFVDSDLEPLLEDLSARGVWQWGSADEINDDAYLHLAILLANACATAFGQQSDENKRLYAEMRLRRLDETQLSGQPLVVEYF